MSKNEDEVYREVRNYKHKMGEADQAQGKADFFAGKDPGDSDPAAAAGNQAVADAARASARASERKLASLGVNDIDAEVQRIFRDRPST